MAVVLVTGRMTAVVVWASCSKEIRHTICYDEIFLGKNLILSGGRANYCILVLNYEIDLSSSDFKLRLLTL